MENEVRLIDANKLLKSFDERLDGAHIQVATRRTGKTLWAGIHVGVNWGRNMVVDALTIDPENLRPKGRWEPRKDAIGFVRCSVCHDCNIYGDWADGEKWRYCPNCGAKMEEVAGDGA